MFKYINNTFKFWTSILSPIPRRKMKFSINFAAMLNLVRLIKSSLYRNPSLELLDITHAQYTYTYLLTGRISMLGLHSLKSYTCVRITSWIVIVSFPKVLVLYFGRNFIKTRKKILAKLDTCICKNICIKCKFSSRQFFGLTLYWLKNSKVRYMYICKKICIKM